MTIKFENRIRTWNIIKHEIYMNHIPYSTTNHQPFDVRVLLRPPSTHQSSAIIIILCNNNIFVCFLATFFILLLFRRVRVWGHPTTTTTTMIMVSLCDANSDEGDTSSSSSSENEGKISYRDYEGPCCQPLLIVPPSSPVLPDKMNASKKVNVDNVLCHLHDIHMHTTHTHEA